MAATKGMRRGNNATEPQRGRRAYPASSKARPIYAHGVSSHCWIAGLLRFIPILFGFVLTACAARQRSFQPPQETGDMDDVAFLHYLATVPVVNVDEGMRGVLMLNGPTETWPTHDERQSELLRLGVIKSAWKLEPNQVLTQGTLAYMIRSLKGLPRSRNELLAHYLHIGDRRYAMRACVYDGLLPYASSQASITGGAFLSLLAKCEP